MSNDFEYYVSPPALRKYGTLFTQIEGKAITLHGKAEKVMRPGNGDEPPREETVPAATQEELAILYAEGNGDPLIFRRKKQAPPEADVKALPK